MRDLDSGAWSLARWRIVGIADDKETQLTAHGSEECLALLAMSTAHGAGLGLGMDEMLTVRGIGVVGGTWI